MKFGLFFFFQLLSLVLAIILYERKRNKLLMYFIPFLLTTVSVEVAGGWYISHGVRNYLIYNVFTTVEFLFYSFLFYTHFKRPKLKRMIRVGMPVFVFFVLMNMAFIQGFNKTFNTYTFLLGSFFIVVFCCFYFYESVLPDKIDQQLSKQAFFWICSGLLIFYLGSVIINALFEYLRNNDLQAEGIKIYGIINNCLNVILYSSFCIAFFLCRNNKKISS